MAKRAIGAVLILAVLLMAPSCSLEEFLKGLSANVLGPNAENAQVVADTIDNLPSIPASEIATKNPTISGLIDKAGINLSDEKYKDVTILDATDASGIESLANMVGSANTGGSEASDLFIEQMGGKPDTTVQDATKGTATVVADILGDPDSGSGETGGETDADTASVLKMFDDIMDGVEELSTREDSSSINRADAAIMQTMLSFITVATDEEEGFLAIGEDGNFEFKDGKEQSQVINENYSLIANTVGIVDKLGPASTAFKEVELDLDLIVNVGTGA